MRSQACIAFFTVFALSVAGAAHADFPPHIWSDSYGDTCGQYVHDVDTDASGSIVIAGDFWGKVNFGGGTLTSSPFDDESDIFLARFDSDGNHIWSKKFGHYNFQYGKAVAFDSAGNVILVGHMHNKADFGGGYLTASGELDIYIAKFDPSGNHVWSKRFVGGSLDWELVEDLAVDGSDNIIITGFFDGEVDFGGGVLTCVDYSDAFVAKFDPDGNHIWSQRYGSIDNQRGAAVDVDDSDNIVVAGVFHDEIDLGGGPLLGDDRRWDIFFAKLTPGGDHVWSQAFGDPGTHEARGVAVDESGNIALTGYISGTVDFGGGPLSQVEDGDIFIAKFDSMGNHLWSSVHGDSGFDAGCSVAFDDLGHTILTGHFRRRADFGGGTLLGGGFFDAFLARFDADGNHLWSKNWGDGEPQFCSSVAVDPAGNLVLTGQFQGDMDFGGGIKTSTGGRDVFLAKFGPTAVGITSSPRPEASALRAHPNPFNPSTTISYSIPAAGRVTLAIFDIRGRLIRTLVNESRPAGEHAAFWDARAGSGQRVASGVYFVRLESNGGILTRKIVLLE